MGYESRSRTRVVSDWPLSPALRASGWGKASSVCLRINQTHSCFRCQRRVLATRHYFPPGVTDRNFSLLSGHLFDIVMMFSPQLGAVFVLLGVLEEVNPMRMRSWLTSLYRRLSSPTIRTGVRRPQRRSLADTSNGSNLGNFYWRGLRQSDLKRGSTRSRPAIKLVLWSPLTRRAITWRSGRVKARMAAEEVCTHSGTMRPESLKEASSKSTRIRRAIKRHRRSRWMRRVILS